MPNLFIIDHSLKEAGGHHFDYARCMSQAAIASGVRPILATHRSFPESGSIGLSSRDPRDPESTHFEDLEHGPHHESAMAIFPVFRQTTYQPDSYLAGLQQMTRSQSGSALLEPASNRPWARWLHWLQNRPHRRRRDRFIRNFAVDCERLFSRFQPQAGDHVLLSTISELELMGLASYLSANPATLPVHWHLQFHFNLFDGRTPEYAAQAPVANAIGSSFLASMARLSLHSIHFYTTSTTLADQYNSLGVGQFDPLPYPVAREFKFRHSPGCESVSESNPSQLMLRKGKSSTIANSNLDATNSTLPYRGDGSESGAGVTGSLDPVQSSPGPIRVGCLGGIRREKQQAGYLQEVVDQLWDDQLGPGKVQLVLQRPVNRFRATAKKIELVLPEGTRSGAVADPIEYADHPLPHDAYVKLIHSIDVGLLFYDSRTYYGRRAGILGEFLSAGKPVIVSAGSWLADQIEIPNREYVSRILQSSHGRRLQGSDLNWNSNNVPLPGGVLSFDRHAHPSVFEFDRHPEETTVGIEFDWHWPKTAGMYCRVELTELDESGVPLRSSCRIVGCPRDRKTCNGLFSIDSRAVRLQFSLANAYDDSAASVRNLVVSTDGISPEISKPMPVGSIGVIAADQSDLVACIDEVVRHFDHYQANARAFAVQWYLQHDPQRTLRRLLSVENAVSHAA